MSVSGERPEALATFAAAARNDGKKPEEIGLTATGETAPVPIDTKLSQEAATLVLQEGVTGEDRGSDEVIDRLPDRIIDNRDAGPDEPEREDETFQQAESYDATLDPRTGRPPTALQAEAQRQERLMDKALDSHLNGNASKETTPQHDGDGVGPEYRHAAMVGSSDDETDPDSETAEEVNDIMTEPELTGEKV